MKTLPVQLLETAISDIEEIAVYIAEKSKSLQVALDFTDRIERRCLKIGDAPLGGVARDDLYVGIRMVPFEKSAVIFYQVTNSHVEIVNVFYGGQNYEAIMRDASD